MADNKTIRIEIINTGGTGGTTPGSGSTRSTGGGTTNRAVLTELSQIEAASKNLIQLQANLKKALKELSVSGQPSEEARKIAARLKDVNAQVQKWNQLGKENTNTWGKALSSYQFKFNALGNIISNVVSTATRMLYQLGSSVVTISKDFEFAMSGVRAITMATDKEFNQLRNDAVRLGGQTIFTATEVSKLQEELAKLGFTVSEIRAATDGVVALAAATGEDLAQSALVAGTVIRGFGLNANELTRVVDVMTESFNRSALDLYKFQETMKYVAPIASKVGFSLEETTALMTKLADQGIVASQAGTGLRNIMLRLANANSTLSKAMGGTAKSLPELIIGLTGLKEAGIDATGALKLVDRYSVTAFLGLINASDKIWEMYKNLTLANDSAKIMSEIRMDNFAGSVEKLSGAWDSFVLTINKSNRALRGIVDAVRWALEGMTDLLAGAETKAGNAGQERFKNFKDSIDKEERLALRRMVETQDKRLQEFNKVDNKTKEDHEAFARDMENIEKTYTQNIFKAREKLDKEIQDLNDNMFAAYANDLGVIMEPNKFADKAKWKRYVEEKAFLDELLQLQTSYQQEKLLAEIEYNAEYLEEQEKLTAEQKRLAKELADTRIELMQDGMFKEIAEVNRHYDELKQKAIQFGLSYKFSEIKRLEELNKIYKSYARLYRDIEIESKMQGLKIEPVEWSKRYKEMERELTAEDKAKRALMAKFGRYGESPESAKLDPTNPDYYKKGGGGYQEDSLFGRMGLTSEQEQALRDGVNFITDQLEKVMDKEVEMADRRVEASERVVNQLQQDLQTEISLQEKGFANNVSLKQRQLEEAKRQQEKALLLQKKAVDDQRKMDLILQASSLITASANTFAQMSKLGPWGIAAAIIEIGAMWGAFGIAQAKAKELTKYGEGGEIDGPKHSQGGTVIEAEGGEYMINAKAYGKNKELVQAINNEDMAQVYRALNQDLSVSLDDSNTARMLGRHFKDKKQITEYPGYRIEQVGNRRRKIRYATI